MSRSPTVLPPALADAFGAPIEPIPVPAGYRTAAAATAVGMVLLPMLYAALVLAVAAAVAAYAVFGVGLFHVRIGLLTLLAYFGPLIVGGVVVVALVKPVFARRRFRSEPVTLDPAAEPVVYGFVTRLADALGAPRPVRIDVDCRANASARFRRGVWSVLRGGDLVLTIGLPLAGDLSVRGLAGVLAHELGHFSQGAGMRLSYLVESVSRWFERVVYERDRFDDWLHREANTSDGWWGLVIGTALAAAGAGRAVLRALMQAGRRLSRSLLRQMEFDADRYEVRVAGAESFRRATDRVILLSAAEGAAFADVDARVSSRRLPDDLPALVGAVLAEMPAEAADALLADAHGATPDPLDTHPLVAERVAAAEREGGAGLAFPDLPAHSLFSDFEALCRRATAALYDESLGDDAATLDLVPTHDTLAARDADHASMEALWRVVQGVGELPDLGDALPLPADPAAALRAARDQMLATAADARAAAAQVAGAQEATLRAAEAASLARVRVRFDAAEFGLDGATVAHAQQRVDTATAERAEALARLAPFHDALRARLAAAVALDGPPPDLALLSMLSAERASLRDLRLRRMQAEVLVRCALAQPDPDAPQAQHLFQSAHDRTLGLRPRLAEIRGRLAGFAAPSRVASPGLSLADVAVGPLPARGDIGGTLGTLAAMGDHLVRVRAILWAELAERIEHAEATLGLDPVPAPEPTAADAPA